MDPNPMLAFFLRLLFEGREVTHIEAAPRATPTDRLMARMVTFHWSGDSRTLTVDKFDARWLELVNYLTGAEWPGSFCAPAV